MNADRFTETTLQLVANAQQIARTRQHQALLPVHLAVALLADGEGRTAPSARVVERVGGELSSIKTALDAV